MINNYKSNCQGCRDGILNQLGHIDGCLRSEAYLLYVTPTLKEGQYNVSLRFADDDHVEAHSYTMSSLTYTNAVLYAIEDCNKRGFDTTTIDVVVFGEISPSLVNLTKCEIAGIKFTH